VSRASWSQNAFNILNGSHNIYSIVTAEDTATGERDGREMATGAESQRSGRSGLWHTKGRLTSTDAGVSALHPMSKNPTHPVQLPEP